MLINANIKISKLSKNLKEYLEDLIKTYESAYSSLRKYAYTKRADIKRYIKWLYKTDPEGFIIAEVNFRIVGFIAVCKDWWDKDFGKVGEIHEFAVREDFQGMGIGSSLFKEGIEYLKKTNKIIGLWVGEENEKAIRFYKKWGFKTVGEIFPWIRMIKIF